MGQRKRIGGGDSLGGESGSEEENLSRNSCSNRAGSEGVEGDDDSGCPPSGEEAADNDYDYDYYTGRVNTGRVATVGMEARYIGVVPQPVGGGAEPPPPANDSQHGSGGQRGSRVLVQQWRSDVRRTGYVNVTAPEKVEITCYDRVVLLIKQCLVPPLR